MMAFLSTALLLLTSIELISGGLRRPPGRLGRCFINWDGGMTPCKGADNKIFNLEKLVVEKKSKTVLALVGQVGLTEDSPKEIKFVLTILKNINGNYEYMAKIEEKNLCEHIGDKNKPWTPFVKEMGISSCPIPKKEYTFTNSTLDTAGFPLTVAQIGDYQGIIELHDQEVQKMCFKVKAKVEPV